MTAKRAAVKKAAARKGVTKNGSAAPPAVRARVIVAPRPEIPDPEGEAIRDALGRLGFDQVSEVRAGRSFEIALAGIAGGAAKDLVGEMCRRLLADAAAEGFAVELLEGGTGAGEP